jgi:hypothetical protein
MVDTAAAEKALQEAVALASELEEEYDEDSAEYAQLKELFLKRGVRIAQLKEAMHRAWKYLEDDDCQECSWESARDILKEAHGS